MTLRSDQGDTPPVYSQGQNFSNFNSNFQSSFNDFALTSNENQYPQSQNPQMGYISNFTEGDFMNQPFRQQNSEETFTRLIDTDNFLDLQPNLNKNDDNKGHLLDPDAFLS